MESFFLAQKKAYHKRGQSLRQGALWRNTERVDTIAFATTLFGAEARHFIRQNKSRPFYLQLSFNAVHNFTHQLPQYYLIENQLNGYRDWDPSKEEYYDWYQQGRYPNNPEGRAHYLGQLHFLDQEVGQIIQLLKTEGLIDNTMIIYIGDNGGSTPIYANNQPLRGSKYLLYEGGTRIPMIMTMPAAFRGHRVVDNRVSAMDVLPTICALTTIEPPKTLDGKNLLPILQEHNNVLTHDTLYWDTGHERAIIADDWKWHEVTDDANAKYEMVAVDLGQFLRNLRTDISESYDYSSQHMDKAVGLKAALEKWQKNMLDSR